MVLQIIIPFLCIAIEQLIIRIDGVRFLFYSQDGWFELSFFKTDNQINLYNIEIAYLNTAHWKTLYK